MVEGLLTWGDNFHSPFILQYCTLFSTYLHCTENSKQIFPEMKLHGLVLNFCIHVSASDLCIPTIGPPTMLYCVCGPIVAIYKSLTDIYECIHWEQGHAVSFLEIFVSYFRYSALAVCATDRIFKILLNGLFEFCMIVPVRYRFWVLFISLSCTQYFKRTF